MISSFLSPQPPQIHEPHSSAADEKDEMTADSNSLDIQASGSDAEDPVSLEGILFTRKGRSSGHASWSWKRRFVFFNFTDGGSIEIYKEPSDTSANAGAAQQPTSVLRTVYSRMHIRSSHREHSKASGKLEIDITADLPWVAKDVENDPSSFVLEISTSPEDDDLGTSRGYTAVSEETQSAQLYQDFADEEIAFASDDDEEDDDMLTLDDGQLGGNFGENMVLSAFLKSAIHERLTWD